MPKRLGQRHWARCYMHWTKDELRAAQGSLNKKLPNVGYNGDEYIELVDRLEAVNDLMRAFHV